MAEFRVHVLDGHADSLEGLLKEVRRVVAALREESRADTMLGRLEERGTRLVSRQAAGLRFCRSLRLSN